MPLIKPEIQEVLRQSGLLGERRAVSEKGSLPERLESAGLGLDEILERIADLAEGTSNESLKARLYETVLKAHGALKESAPAPPSFTIVIQGGEAPALQGIPQGINPILLPRQLLKELTNESDQLTN